MRSRSRLLLLVSALPLAGTAHADGDCGGPVEESRAREIAIELLAGLPSAARYRPVPEAAASLDEEYRFLFPPAGGLGFGERISSSSSAQILVHRATGCPRHQRW